MWFIYLVITSTVINIVCSQDPKPIQFNSESYKLKKAGKVYGISHGGYSYKVSFGDKKEEKSVDWTIDMDDGEFKPGSKKRKTVTTVTEVHEVTTFVSKKSSTGDSDWTIEMDDGPFGDEEKTPEAQGRAFEDSPGGKKKTVTTVTEIQEVHTFISPKSDTGDSDWTIEMDDGPFKNEDKKKRITTVTEIQEVHTFISPKSDTGDSDWTIEMDDGPFGDEDKTPQGRTFEDPSGGKKKAVTTVTEIQEVHTFISPKSDSGDSDWAIEMDDDYVGWGIDPNSTTPKKKKLTTITEIQEIHTFISPKSDSGDSDWAIEMDDDYVGWGIDPTKKKKITTVTEIQEIHTFISPKSESGDSDWAIEMDDDYVGWPIYSDTTDPKKKKITTVTEIQEIHTFISPKSESGDSDWAIDMDDDYVGWPISSDTTAPTPTLVQTTPIPVLTTSMMSTLAPTMPLYETTTPMASINIESTPKPVNINVLYLLGKNGTGNQFIEDDEYSDSMDPDYTPVAKAPVSVLTIAGKEGTKSQFIADDYDDVPETNDTIVIPPIDKSRLLIEQKVMNNEVLSCYVPEAKMTTGDNYNSSLMW